MFGTYGGCDIRCSDSACRHGCKRSQIFAPGTHPHPGVAPGYFPDQQSVALNRIAEAIEKLAKAISTPPNEPEERGR